MITQENIRELAGYESPNSCALTFYYQPITPKDQSHREEAILLKDMVRQAMRDADKDGAGMKCAKQDLQRILDMADRIHNNGGKAKLIFADSSTGLWREFDTPARLSKSEIRVNKRFHLRPLSPLMQNAPKVCVVLADRQKSRLFEYHNENVRELVDFFQEIPRKGENEGFAGFDAGHVERHVAEQAKHHYKRIDDTLIKMFDRGGWDLIAFGCREENWPEIQEVLHTYVTDRLIGRFRIDPSNANPDAIAEGVERLLNERAVERRQDLLREVIGQANRNGNGVVGLKAVLKSLERGEIQTIVVDNQFHGAGTECLNCGHIEMGHNSKCELCRQDVRQLNDLSDALFEAAVRGSIEVMYIDGDEALANAGHIGALLRFRADQNTPMKLAS